MKNNHTSNWFLKFRHYVVQRILRRKLFSIPWLESHIDETAQVLQEGGLSINTYLSSLDQNDAIRIPFRILLLSSTHDLNLAVLNVRNMKKLYGPEILDINLVVTDDALFPPNAALDALDADVNVIRESEIAGLTSAELNGIIGRYKEHRQAWIRQQAIKWLFCHQSHHPVLVLDSDLFFLHKLPLLSHKYEILFLGSGMHWQYNHHFKVAYNRKVYLLDFVTHFSLMKAEIVKELFGDDIVLGICKWLSAKVPRYEGSPVSEYQTYGNFVLSLENRKHRFLIPRLETYNADFSRNTFALQKCLESDQTSTHKDTLLVINKFRN